jgi:hypothetical protein
MGAKVLTCEGAKVRWCRATAYDHNLLNIAHGHGCTLAPLAPSHP